MLLINDEYVDRARGEPALAAEHRQGDPVAAGREAQQVVIDEDLPIATGAGAEYRAATAASPSSIARWIVAIDSVSSFSP